MKIRVAFFVVFLACWNISKSGDLIVNTIGRTDSIPPKYTSANPPKAKPNTPFQGKRVFCSADSDTKYAVTIKGDRVIIVTGNSKITGIFKRDLLFTDDAEEIEYRKLAPKNNYGKFYVIGADYFSVLNAENSEYRYYDLCK